MPLLLLEIGVEELPASMVVSASQQLAIAVSAAVREAKLGAAEGVQWFATPRRLIVFVPDVAERQEDRTERKRGPSAAAAYKDGEPTPALLGFARGAGVAVGEVEVEDEYVWATVSMQGKPAADALGEPLAEAVRSTSFDKTMRWGAGRTRFSRPIRWIVALLGDEVVPLKIESVESGRMSRGHRFLAPQDFEAEPLTFLDDLRKRFVEPDVAARRQKIESDARALAPTAVIDDALLDENTNLTEWPMPIVGRFRNDFLTLPKSVLVTAMAKHERFFPIEKDGNISTEFVSVTNAGDPETVRAGNEWVLNARLNDALFFYEEDSRKSIEDFWQATERIVFQEKLGTIKQRSERLAELAERIAADWLIDNETTVLDTTEDCSAREAGRLCKADLSTGLVSELPSLQGKVGAEYARKQGIAEDICRAIELHYAPSDDFLANAVMCADQADRLAGYLGIGEAPSGSSDPYALRRAATMLMQTRDGNVCAWVNWAAEGYEEQGFQLQEYGDALQELLYSRLQALYPDIPYDALAAARGDGFSESTPEFVERARFLGALSSDIDFVRTAKRPGNIVEAARKKGLTIARDVDTGLFEHDEERNLYEGYSEFGNAHSLAKYADNLMALKPAIDAYFDKVMVMVNDEKVRANRLWLLSKVNDLFRRLGDFSKIVIEED
ncbi:MAG: glycine--tRNA ligase subunit beta [Armatimonadota bacterium]|nr:glycine--tRNA ligase subunit beta [Armatimonadota bacterium]